MKSDGRYERFDSTFDGLSGGMVAELRRLASYPNYSIFAANLAREYEEQELSAGPVRAVLEGSFPPAVRFGILVVTDLDVVAFGAGPGNSRESIVIAKEWIADVKVQWRRNSGRITIELHDNDGLYETEVKLKGSQATAEVAERWRLAALS